MCINNYRAHCFYEKTITYTNHTDVAWDLLPPHTITDDSPDLEGGIDTLTLTRKFLVQENPKAREKAISQQRASHDYLDRGTPSD